jgi:hypothetical protein
MVKLLKNSELDPIMDAVDDQLTKADMAEEMKRFDQGGTPGDLSDGGTVVGARLTPMSNGVRMSEGRAAARRAWTWNGTETVLPLAWDPSGKVHDGARKYLLKRFCKCCYKAGFRGAQCDQCVKNRCERCNSSRTPGKVIPAFYLKKDDVPFPERFYGSISCFLPMCPRSGDRGFKTEEEMRMHAQSRHRLEYRAYLETQGSRRQDEVETLKRRIDELMLARASEPIEREPAGRQRGRPRKNTPETVTTPSV